ncbi:MAG: hypothetical protein JJ863_19155 [Deltaproteobacteria bacterium]|nr:hypothetical protein [Deltaproteobacteria bacterium]
MQTLYEEVLETAREFMGPAAEDYIRRRIRIVMRGAEPESMVPEKLERLVAGIEMTAKGYMSAGRAERFCAAIRKLADR